MSSCILTIIKNENLYLDEWIKYHLNIGISHIFIFEDIDSESHKNITNKYSNQVSLTNITTLLASQEIQHIQYLKQTRKGTPQIIYVKKGLSYIKENFNYDWCFLIDCDEFITLENSHQNLEDILSLYNAYDAILLQWKCFGANGLVQQPDYTNQSIIDIFTKPVQDVPLSSPTYDKKTCYNLNTFLSESWCNNIHQPSDKCNFCNTAFQRDRVTKVYTNLYLRHYITKSWEEYVWKKTTRGYFVGNQRTFSAFFKMNPDMLPLKNKLISQIKETLVILPYINRGQGKEIYLALQGWKKNCQFPCHFVVIGEFDEQLKQAFDWVDFIYVPTITPKKGQYNPHLDMQHKMELAYEKFHDQYNGFIWMVDDNYAIKPFDIDDILTIHYHNTSFTGVESAPTSFWKHDKWKTRQLLDKENLPHVNYTSHFPCYFNFKYLKEIWDKFDMRNESYVVEDIYFNYFKLYFKQVPDKTIRLGIWNQDIFHNNFEAAVADPNIKFVCNSVEGWSKELEAALENIIEKDN